MSDVRAIIFYDGLCRLCSREIAHYRRMRGHERLAFVDITDPAFDAAALGLDPVAVHKVMHVRDAAGRLHLGVEAFVEIWSHLDATRWLVPVARTWPARVAMNLGYAVFARVRPWLPRKACADSPYCGIDGK